MCITSNNISLTSRSLVLRTLLSRHIITMSVFVVFLLNAVRIFIADACNLIQVTLEN